MGNNGLIANGKSKVEGISLTKSFEEVCPIYMSYGMSYDEFWYKSPYRTRFYLKSHKLKIKQKDEEMWIQGMYVYEALCDVSPILHPFSKKGTKPLPYSTKPIMAQEQEVIKGNSEEDVKNAQLIAQIHFNNWARMVKKQFKNKQ